MTLPVAISSATNKVVVPWRTESWVRCSAWEYDVAETSRAEFERTYGAAGDWVQLFSSSDGFRGTEQFVSLRTPVAT